MKRTTILLVVCLVSLLVVFLVIGSRIIFNPIPRDAKIIFNRRGCFSEEGATPCPVYTVTIEGDGSATFVGEYFVQEIGVFHYEIPKEDIQTLFEAVQEAYFFSMADEYVVEVPEYTGATTIITMNGRTKEVEHYGVGCGRGNPTLDNGPESLCQLENLIDEIAQSNVYIYGLE